MAFRYLVQMSKDMPLLLRNNVNLLWLRSQPKSNLMPLGGGMGSLFKLQTIKDNWETIPIFVTAFIAAMFPVIHTIFRLTHAEDLRFWPGSRMKNEKHRWILQGPPKPSTYYVANQKWEWPQGLLDALRTDDNESNGNESNGAADDKCKPKKVSFKVLTKK